MVTQSPEPGARDKIAYRLFIILLCRTYNTICNFTLCDKGLKQVFDFDVTVDETHDAESVQLRC